MRTHQPCKKLVLKKSTEGPEFIKLARYLNDIAIEVVNVKKWKFVLIIVLVAALAGNIYFWYYQYAIARSREHAVFESGRILGYQLGYGDGNQSGYQLGYAHGYDNGNASGYQSGYANGYSDGNHSGYQLGYDNGYDTGYESGYLAGFYDGNESGFAEGYVQGVEDGAGRGYTIRDPTYDEAIAFTAWDKTDENEYSENYTCHHFTADFKNNAFEAGYRCGYVVIEFPEYAHAIVCFNTTDYGVIFIEPQWEDIVILTIGQLYSDLNEYEPPDYDDTIVSFTIIW